MIVMIEQFIKQGWVPPTCSLTEQQATILWPKVRGGIDPCDDCNYSRGVCKGRPRKVYLNRRQSDLFGVVYFEAGTLEISADKLLGSKYYDSSHREYLAGKGSLLLKREEGDAPGWWNAVPLKERG